MLYKKSLKSLFVSAIWFGIASSPFPVFAQSDTGEVVEFADLSVCLPGEINVPKQLREATGGSPDEQPIEIAADEIEASGNQKATLTGNAHVVQGNRGVYADTIVYDQESYQANAKGNVIFYTPNGDEIRAEAMDIEVDTFIGDAEIVSIKIADTAPNFEIRKHKKFEEDYSVFAPFRNTILDIDDEESDEDSDEKEKVYYQRARATAETMEFEGNDFEVLHNAVMTTCPEGSQDVTLSANTLELDHATGIGSAKSMTVRLKGVPIFYFPTVSFPINDERKTGFLFPTIAEENESGVILDIPYYINIATNQDATIIPRILTNRGAQVYSEYRYLGEDAEGEIKGEFLPSDDVFGQDRYAYGLDLEYGFAETWRGNVDLQKVSDSDYFRDFTNNVDIVASSFVPQRANVSHTGDLLYFNARVQSVDSINDSISSAALPYDILPELRLDLKPQEVGLLEAGFKTTYTSFDHDDSTRITGTRQRLNPYLSVPLEELYGYVTPKVSLYDISYSLDNSDLADSPSATIPVFSVDGSLVFERLFENGETPFYQTLEPRIFYVNIPDETDQNTFPDFDTGESTINSFGHLFRENRFFGGDRIGDTEQVTIGLTSRIVNDDTGDQRLKLSLGQVYFLQDRVIRINPDDPPITTSESSFIGEITADLGLDWSVSGFASWNTGTSTLDTVRLGADYNHSLRRKASIDYTEVNNLSEQINLSLDTPLSPRWQLNADTAYSLQDDELRSSSLGISYDGCCWAVRLRTQRYLDGTSNFTNRFLITLELDDLGQIRSNL